MYRTIFILAQAWGVPLGFSFRMDSDATSGVPILPTFFSWDSAAALPPVCQCCRQQRPILEEDSCALCLYTWRLRLLALRSPSGPATSRAEELVREAHDILLAALQPSQG